MSNTIRESLQAASSFLNQASILAEECHQHAEWLLLHVTKWSRTELLLRWNEPLQKDVQEVYQQLLARRAAGEPVQYILGSQWFYGREFMVTPAVLIPRPETELLIEQALSLANRMNLQSDSIIADIGVGSGIIGITMALERPNAKVVGVDLSPLALEIASRNAKLHQVQARIEWLQGSYLEPILSKIISPEIILSNPPYIPQKELEHLQREVRDFEPHLALNGGDDGLDPYRLIIQQVERFVRPPSIIGFEVGIHQADLVCEMLKNSGYWEQCSITNDWQGIGRIVMAFGRK